MRIPSPRHYRICARNESFTTVRDVDSTQSAPPPFWRPDIHADRRPALLARGRIKAALRRWFEARAFTEVEAAILQLSPGNETHLHGFATTLIDNAAQAHPYYLHTSPEFAAKKLLAAGEAQIFDFARVFRNRERTALHHPEFTMLEWYRAGESYEVLMQDCAALLAEAARAAGASSLRWRGREADPFAAPERLTLQEAFARHAGIDLLRTVTADGRSTGAGSPPMRRRPASASRPTIPGRTSSAASCRSASSPIWVMAAPPSSASTRSARRRWPGQSPAIRAWRNASSSMPAASNSPMPSAS